MPHIRIENAAPGGPVRRITVGGIVYEVSEGRPVAGGMVEILTVDPHESTPPTALRLAEIRSNHHFEQQLHRVQHDEEYETQASVDRKDLLAAFDEMRKIVGDWCVESNTSGGIDAGDLAWRLEQAGLKLWDDEDDG